MEASSLPPILDPRQFSTLIPEGQFYGSNPDQEYQFMLRYITRLLSLVDHSESGLLAAEKSPIECRFVQRNQDLATSPTRYQSDARFIAEFTMRCCFSLTTVVGAMDYLLKLHSMGAVRLHATSWKTIFVVCCLISEKVWEDNYVHPSHIINQFGYLAKGGSTIPKKEYLSLQMLFAKVLNWNTNTTSSRYLELVTNIMGVAVPLAVFKQVPAGYAGFVPRPLPPLPKMSTIPTIKSHHAPSVVRHNDDKRRHHGSATSSTVTSSASYANTPMLH